MKTSINRSWRLLMLSILGCFCFGVMNVQAEDWPQWRGPNRDGKSADTGLLKEWPAGGPKLAWKATGLGQGLSNMSVAAGWFPTSQLICGHNVWVNYFIHQRPRGPWRCDE